MFKRLLIAGLLLGLLLWGITAALAQSRNLLITWTAPTTNTDASALTDLAGYKLYRCQDPGGGCTPTLYQTLGLVTQYLNVGLSSGLTHRYQVKAFDTTGNESPLSTASEGHVFETEIFFQ